MRPGEQQVSPTLDGIRKDHVARYALAAELFAGQRVLDVGCGVGYGASMMGEAGCKVKAVDIDEEAIAYAKKHYANANVEFLSVNAENVGPFTDLPFATAFEVIEHLKNPLPMLRRLNRTAATLLASVPNELVFPHKGKYAYHYRHYTPEAFEQLLNAAGYRVDKWWGQATQESEPEENLQGHTIIALCKRSENIVSGETYKRLGVAPEVIPASVAIVAMGRSCASYIRQCASTGNRFLVADETWVINSMGSSITHDLLFHMDDLEVQERRAEADPGGNVANMMTWLKNHPRFYTSRKVPGYHGAMEYPLEEVIRHFGVPYLNSTVAYAVAYALFKGVKQIQMYGSDYSYPNLHKAEKGRACVEFWLGLGAANGVHVVVSPESTLLDAAAPMHEKIYGYDAYDMAVDRVDGKTVVTRKIKSELPSAAEIESRYTYMPPQPTTSKVAA